MAYQPTTNFGWAMPRGGDQAQISVINQQFTAKADEIVYQTRRMIAPGYIDDGSKTYHEGDIVEYENVDYVCTGTTSGAWDSSKWDDTDMATQIQEAKESGGTNVEANPVEAATADLHKLKVDTTVYGIPDPTVTKTATGNPIEFSDGADAPLVKCVTEIQGSQDLHGYDKPWAPGAGKNKFNEDGTYLDNKYIANDGTITNSAPERPCKVFNQKISVTPGERYYVSANSSISAFLRIGEYTSNDEFIIRDLSNEAVNPTITFVANANASYVLISPDSSCSEIMFEKNNVKTNYEPYSNICPITAYTEGEIEVRGKNLCPTDSNSFTGSATWVSLNNVNANTITNGTELNLKAGQYTLSFFDVTGVTTKQIANTSGSYVVNTDANSASFTLNSDKKLYFRIKVGSGTNASFKVQIEKGSTATSWEPYTSTTHTTTYSDAIYRGSEDVVNGTETHDMVKVVFNGSENWRLNSNYPSQFAIIVEGLNVKFDNASYANFAIMNFYNKNNTGAASRLNGEFCIYMGSWGEITTTNKWLAIRDDRFATAEDFKTWLSSNPLELAYELATPTTNSVTPTNLPIRTLSGYNHIESSTGDMEVEYITQTYQPLVDLIDEAADTKHTYSTTEHVVGKWIDGSDVYEKTIDLGSFSAGSWSGHTIESSTSISLLIDYDGYMVESNIMYALPDPSVRITVDSNQNLIFTGTSSWNVTSGYITIRYTKTSSNNRSLSTLSKGPSEESVDKVDEPTETIEEKEENAGESNSENER